MKMCIFFKICIATKCIVVIELFETRGDDILNRGE